MVMPYIIGIALATAGIIGLSVDTLNNVKAMGGEYDVALYVATISILGAVAGLAGPFSIKRNMLVGFVLMVGWAGATLFSIGASIDRIAGAKDDKVRASVSLNDERKRINKRIKDLTAKRDKEAKRGGCKTICMRWQDKLERLEEKRDNLGSAATVHSGGKRIEALTFGPVRAEQWQLAHPVVGVVALSLMVNALFVIAGGMLATSPTKQVIASVQVAEVLPPSPVVQALKIAGPINNRELAKRLGWSESRTSREGNSLRRSGMLSSKQHGRAKLIALA